MIVITTPAGQVGRQVLGNLLDSGQELRVIARNPSQLPAGVRGDLDIIEGSHGDAAVADQTFAGADVVFWVTPPDPRAPSVDAAFVGTRDIAAAASRLLPDARWSGAGEVPLLGPEDLSFNDMAEIISQALGKDVRFQQITFQAYKDRFIRLGMSEAMAQGIPTWPGRRTRALTTASSASRRT